MEIRWYQVPIRYRLSQLTRETESPIGKATETGVSRALTETHGPSEPVRRDDRRDRELP